jgi:hypothetical protein
MGCRSTKGSKKAITSTIGAKSLALSLRDRKKVREACIGGICAGRSATPHSKTFELLNVGSTRPTHAPANSALGVSGDCQRNRGNILSFVRCTQLSRTIRHTTEPMYTWCTLTPEDIFVGLSVQLEGLNKHEVERRLARHRPNALVVLEVFYFFSSRHLLAPH